jgi:hypothetical protein
MPSEFARMFTDVKWLMWNSFNNGKDGATKYRVLFPSKTPMTSEMYTAIWDAIAARIKDFGFFVGSNKSYDKALNAGRTMPPQSGLDVSKRTPNSFFYMPARAGLGAKFTFWREYWEVAVPLLDPDLWVSYAPLIPQEYEINQPHRNPGSSLLQRVGERLANDAAHRADEDAGHVDSEQALHAAQVAARDAAIAQWRATPQGQGNDAFFALGKRLMATGMQDFEVRTTLEHEAAYAPQRSQPDRRAQIPSILKSLRRFVPRKAAA